MSKYMPDLKRRAYAIVKDMPNGTRVGWDGHYDNGATRDPVLFRGPVERIYPTLTAVRAFFNDPDFYIGEVHVPLTRKLLPPAMLQHVKV